MIAKRITSKAAKPRMARLVRYVVAAEGGIDPRSWERTADYVLCSKTNNRGEKVGGVRVTNCNTDDPAAATTLIEVTQSANTRSKTDKTYHLVFSFPPGEQPSLETLHKIEDELVASIGYADHQRISAVHIDTKHLHVHVAINKVHPKGFQNIEPYFDKLKLMETCERLEIQYGLTRTNHGLDGREPKAKVKSKQAEAEIHSGIETLTGHVTREIAPRLKEAKSWKEAHSILAEHGLEIKLRGAGLVIGSGNLWVKASQCDRALSFKAMTDRFGPFEKATSKAKKPFEPKPRQAHPLSGYLYEQYQREKQRALARRNHSLDQIKYEGALAEAQLQKWRMAQRAAIKVSSKGLARRASLAMIRIHTKTMRDRNRNAIETKRRNLMSLMPVPSWIGWLTAHAEAGNADALSVLRSKQERDAMNGNCFTAPVINDKSNIVIPRMNPTADKNGYVSYKTMDGGLVLDHKHHVQSLRTTAGAAQMALELAAKRFDGQALVVEGHAEFKTEVARLAGIRGVNVRFSDPEMEKIRIAAIQPRERGKSIDKGRTL